MSKSYDLYRVKVTQRPHEEGKRDPSAEGHDYEKISLIRSAVISEGSVKMDNDQSHNSGTRWYETHVAAVPVAVAETTPAPAPTPTKNTKDK